MASLSCEETVAALMEVRAAEAPPRRYTNTEEQVVIHVLQILFDAAILELRAVGHLCEAGISRASWTHVRNLYETQLSALYIGTNPIQLCRQYIDFGFLQLQKSYKRQMEHPMLRHMPDPQYEAALDMEVERILKEGHLNEKHRNWRKKSFAQTATDLGSDAENDYWIFYQLYSQFAHSSVWATTMPENGRPDLPSRMACGYASTIALARAEILDVCIPSYAGLKKYCEDVANGR